MKPGFLKLAALLAMTVWQMNSSAFAATVSDPQSPAASKPDLDGSIQPPVYPTEPPRVVPPAPQIPAATPTGQLPSTVIAWDGEQKEDIVKSGAPEAKFKFSLTNVSPDTVTIFTVHTSCGCTAAHLPPMPWKLSPGEDGEINVTMNLAGKSGTVFKTVTVSTDHGTKTLMVKSVIMAPTAEDAAMADRSRNQMIAQANRQSVFQGDCARCHAEPAKGKMGQELYTAVCGVCHEAEHRATMVADLHHPKQDMSRELWYVWISYGKPGSLMPAFSQSQGGPLSEEQIRSLVDYLSAVMPSKATPATAGGTSAKN